VNRNLGIILAAFVLIIIAFFIYNASTTKTTINGTSSSSPVPTKQVMEINELKIEDIKEGQGVSVKEGDIVEVNYTGTLTNGTKFDSSYDRNETFQFNVGAGQVIQGWEKGLVGMKKGGIRKLTIPSSLAYGEQGVPGAIPPNSPLIFEIELVSIN